LSIRKNKDQTLRQVENPRAQLVFSALTIEQEGSLTIISFSLLSMNAFHSRLCGEIINREERKERKAMY
jgi:hypothetical protein